MQVEPPPTRPAPEASIAVPPPAIIEGSPRRVVWRAWWMSRLVVVLTGSMAVLFFGLREGSTGYDPAGLTSPFGYFGNLLAAPVARWDSVWYLAITRDGYGHEFSKTAFFPLYPLMTRGLSFIVSSQLVAGVLISLAAFAVGLLLLHTLVSLELDSERADITVMLLAFCPMAYFFSAVYSESIYLALSVGCILQARRGSWASAGLLGGLAASSRNSGLMLIVPFVLLFLYGPRADREQPVRAVLSGWRGWLRALVPRFRPTPALAWGLLIPLGLVAYVVFLGISTGHPFAPFNAQKVWFRQFHGPFGGVWTGAVAAWDGLRQLLHGPPPPLYFTKAGGDPMMVAGQNLMLFAFLALGLVACVGALRRLPIAYGAYAIASLAMPLSYPVTPQPLASLPRYEVVLFPLFMWAASVVSRRRILAPAIGTLAVLLGLFTAEFATWRFVA